MADEQESQKEAQKNNELPEGVGLNQPEPIDEYSKQNEQVKDKLSQFGETDLEHFMSKVTSDAIYGKQVLRKMLGLDADKPFINLETYSSPQEKNQTGMLDHSTYPPKVKGTKDGTKSMDPVMGTAEENTDAATV